MKPLTPRGGFNPKTAARAQNSPRSIKPGPGTSAVQSQIKAPPAPFQNRSGAANLPAPRNRNVVSNSYGKASNPMSDAEGLRAVGYKSAPKPYSPATNPELHFRRGR